MAVQFALRPRIRLEHAALPQRRRSSLRVHPLVLPIGVYWLTITAIAHAVIEHTRHPAEARVVNDEPRPELQPASTGRENAPAQAVARPAPVPDDEPPQAAADPVAQNQSSAFSVALTHDTERAPAIAPPTAREPERAREHQTSMPRAAETTAATAATALAARDEPASPRRESNQQTTERPFVGSPSQADDAPTKSSSLPSCEAASEAAEETIDLRGARGAPDLTRDAFASTLENGAYLNRCAIPARTALEICAAVQGGRVVGVSVRAEPRDSAISNCVRRAVAGLRFPVSARLDVTRTRFEATR
jgi:hypothetical protein